MAPLALVQNLATRWRHLYQLQLHCLIASLPWIVLLTLSVSIQFVSSSAGVKLSFKNVAHSLSLFVCLFERPDTKIGPGDLGPIKKHQLFQPKTKYINKIPSTITKIPSTPTKISSMLTKIPNTPTKTLRNFVARQSLSPIYTLFGVLFAGLKNMMPYQK